MRALALAIPLVVAPACGDNRAGTPTDAQPADARPADAPMADAAADASTADTTPPMSSASPAAGAFFQLPTVVISTDEPATVYYTTDGSAPTTSSTSGTAPVTVTGLVDGTPLRYFAVDSAGNTEAPDHTATYTVDDKATLSISLASQTVTVTEGAAGLGLAGTAVYDADADTVTVTLTATNMTAGLMFNLKGVYATPSQGALTGDGTLSGAPFSYFGPQALDAAASNDATFTINGVDGTVDPITVDVTWRTDATWANQGAWRSNPFLVDSSGSGEEYQADSNPLGYRPGDGDSRYQAIVASPDGRYLYLGSRNKPEVDRFDMTTLETTVGISLEATDVGAVTWLGLSPDGATLYAILLTGEHASPAGGDSSSGAGCGAGTCANSAPDLTLVALSRADLSEQGRVALVTDATDGHVRAGFASIDATGQRLAVPVAALGQVFVVDLTAMTVAPPIDVSATVADPHLTTFSPDGATLYVASRQGGTTGDSNVLATVDLGTSAVTSLTPTVQGDQKGGCLVVGPDGRLYLGSANTPHLLVYDPAGDAWTDLGIDEHVFAIRFVSGGRYLLDLGEEYRAFSLAGDSPVILNPDTVSGINGLPVEQHWGEQVAVTPD